MKVRRKPLDLFQRLPFILPRRRTDATVKMGPNAPRKSWGSACVEEIKPGSGAALGRHTGEWHSATCASASFCWQNVVDSILPQPDKKDACARPRLAIPRREHRYSRAAQQGSSPKADRLRKPRTRGSPRESNRCANLQYFSQAKRQSRRIRIDNKYKFQTIRRHLPDTPEHTTGSRTQGKNTCPSLLCLARDTGHFLASSIL